jgi:hypothetical protein
MTGYVEEAFVGTAAATQERVRPYVSSGEEEPMSTSAAANHHSSKGADLRFWRILVFSGIGVLYIASLFVPPLREALARVFSYFPR